MSDGNKEQSFKRYRPTRLDEYVGNESVKADIISQLNKEQVPNVWLLKGASGCGKTLLARLIAEEIYDKKAQYIDYNKEYDILRGTDDFSVNEIDLSCCLNEPILDNIVKDIDSKNLGVVIFDEVHMATDKVQEKVAKLIAEARDKCTYILCTTDIKKVIPPLKDEYTLTMDVEMTSEDIMRVLEHVCKEENISYDLEGLSLIADDGKDSIRNQLATLHYLSWWVGSLKYADIKDRVLREKKKRG